MKNSRGQSAIEYVTTYGWIAFVAIVISVAFISTTLNGKERCGNTIKGLESEDRSFYVSNVSTSGRAIDIELSNSDTEAAQLELLGMFRPNGTKLTEKRISEIIEPRSEYTVNLDRPTDESCGRYNLTVYYQQEGNSTLSGQITG